MTVREDGGEEELQCPAHFENDALHLSEEQLRKPTTEVFEAKHLAHKDDKNHIDNFTGEYAHVRSSWCLGFL